MTGTKKSANFGEKKYSPLLTFSTDSCTPQMESTNSDLQVSGSLQAVSVSGTLHTTSTSVSLKLEHYHNQLVKERKNISACYPIS